MQKYSYVTEVQVGFFPSRSIRNTFAAQNMQVTPAPLLRNVLNLQSYILLQARMLRLEKRTPIKPRHYIMEERGNMWPSASFGENLLRIILGSGNIYLREVPLFSPFPLAVEVSP